jgi:hypothetical protein
MCENKSLIVHLQYLGANVDFVLLLRRVPSYKKGIGTRLLEQVQLHPPRLSNPLPKRHGVNEKCQIIKGFDKGRKFSTFSYILERNLKIEKIFAKFFANEVFARLT